MAYTRIHWVLGHLCAIHIYILNKITNITKKHKSEKQKNLIQLLTSKSNQTERQHLGSTWKIGTILYVSVTVNSTQ